MQKKKTKNITLAGNDLIPFIDGLDLSVSLSILTYLASFFFSSYDTRVSFILMAFVILLSCVSRIFDIKLINFIKKNFLSKINILNLLILSYSLHILVFSNFPNLLSIMIFCVARIIFGIFISLAYSGINFNGKELNCNLCEIKNWFFYALGLAFGALMYILLNEIYSNDFLNHGGWKIFYIIIILAILLMLMIFKFVYKTKIFLQFEYDKSKSFNLTEALSTNFLILIPLLSFAIFSSSTWLPKFSNPENLHFLNYDFLYLFLTVMTLVFITPLANLVGKRKSVIFFNISIVLFATICSFIKHDSSYSIDFLKLFIALVASFSICNLVFQLQLKKQSTFNVITHFNLSLFSLAFLLPMTFYCSIYYTINYSVIYIFFALVYFINNIIFTLNKNG